jgi:polyhydroxyalkanoate synthesis regulator phasin
LDTLTQRAAVELLCEKLWDNNLLAKRAAVEGLIKLEAKRAASMVDNCKSSVSNQDQVWFAKKVKQLRETGEGSSVAKLKKDFEELTQYVKKLEEKIQNK